MDRRNRIEIWRDANCYYATYKGPHSAEVRRLFGTVCIPLPDGPETRVDRIAARLRQTQPDTEVIAITEHKLDTSDNLADRFRNILTPPQR